jgi:hypothetical protein
MVESPSRRDVEQFRELTDRILASSQLNRSIRLSKLFQYLCARVLDDDIQEIHELELGQKVFGRAPRYDTMADNIVRVHASMLRKRLAEYFRTEGQHEKYIVEIPRGNYAPVFRHRTTEELALASTELRLTTFPTLAKPAVPESPNPASALAPATIPAGNNPGTLDYPGTLDKKLWTAIVIAIGFAILSCVLYIRLQRAATISTGSPTLSGTVGDFWSTIFPPNRTTDVVMDDASLGLYEEATNQSVPIGEYFDRIYMRNVFSGPGPAEHDPNWLHQLLLRRQSSYAASSLVWKMAQIASAERGQARLQFARDLSFQQTKLDNLVLLGTSSSNPWIQLFEGGLTLHWAFDPVSKSYYPVDTSTPDGATRFKPTDESKSRDGYATVSFLSNLSGTGKTLIISGSGGTATDAALHWLLQENSFQQLRSQLPGASNSVLPPFEALLRIEKGMDRPRNIIVAICRPVHDSSRTAQK